MTGKQKLNLKLGDQLDHPRRGRFTVTGISRAKIEATQTAEITDVDLEEWQPASAPGQKPPPTTLTKNQDQLDVEYEHACRSDPANRNEYVRWLASLPHAPSAADYIKWLKDTDPGKW